MGRSRPEHAGWGASVSAMSGVGRCAGCGEAVGSGDRYCQQCGRPVVAPAVDGGPHGSRSRWPVTALAVAGLLAVAAAVVIPLLLTRASSSAPYDSPTPPVTSPGGSSPGPGSASPTGGTTASDASSSNPPPGATLLSWNGVAAAEAPSTSPDGVDGAGRRTTYVAANMLDADPTTAWRMDGDGTGAVLTFTLDQPRPITQLALVNGFAKTDPATGDDRYIQERRILRVSWFVGGRGYQQLLTDGVRQLQWISIPRVQTATVQLRIDAVTEPGDPDFDKTAISDVLIAGG
jgi:hypothetical protein